MNVQRINVLTMLGVVALAIGVFWRSESERPRPKARAALDAIPAGSGFLLTIDLAKLRNTVLGRVLLAAGRELPGVGPLDAICGFDPSESVRELAVASPALGDELGIAAAGEFSAQQIADCAEAVVRRRGGSPVKSTIDEFSTIRDRDGFAGEIAVRDGGPVLLGGGRYLRDMIDASSGKAPTSARDGAHRELRRRLGEGGAVLASWQFDEGFLERATGDPDARLSPLAQVRAAGFRVDADVSISVSGLLGCDTKTACSEVAEVLRSASRDFGPLIAREIGHDVLRDAKIELDGASVEIGFELTALRALTIAQRLLSHYAPEPRPASPASAPRDGAAD